MCADKTVSCRLKIESLFYPDQGSLFWVQWIKSQTFHAGSELKHSEPAQRWRTMKNENKRKTWELTEQDLNSDHLTHIHLTNKSRPCYQTLLKPDAEHHRRIADDFDCWNHWWLLKQTERYRLMSSFIKLKALQWNMKDFSIQLSFFLHISLNIIKSANGVLMFSVFWDKCLVN